MSLQHTPPGTIRRFAGRCTLALLAAGALTATLGARAEQTVSAPRYSVAMAIGSVSAPAVSFKLTADELGQAGKQGLPRVITPAGEKFGVSSGEWRLEMMLHPADTSDKVWLTGKLFKGDALVTAPTLLTRIGEAATVRVGEGDEAFSMAMTVTPQP